MHQWSDKKQPNACKVALPGVQLPSVGGGDTFGTCNDDATKTGADDDYIVDTTAAQGAWDPGPTQDLGLFWSRFFFNFL